MRSGTTEWSSRPRVIRLAVLGHTHRCKLGEEVIDTLLQDHADTQVANSVSSGRRTNGESAKPPSDSRRKRQRGMRAEWRGKDSNLKSISYPRRTPSHLDWMGDVINSEPSKFNHPALAEHLPMLSTRAVKPFVGKEERGVSTEHHRSPLRHVDDAHDAERDCQAER